MPQNPPEPTRRHRAAFFGGSGGLILGGVLLDVAGLVNVPGAAQLRDGTRPESTATDLATGLVLLVVAAWITVIWRRRLPALTMAAGGVLALVGTSYLLMLLGAAWTVRQRPDRTRLIAALTAATAVLFAAREALTGWGAALPWYLTQSSTAQDEPVWMLVSFASAIVSLGATAAAVHYGRMRARADRSEARAAQEVRRADALTEQMVRQAERERIARDMHDALAHRLSVVSLHAGALEAAASAGADGGAGGISRAGEIARTVREQTHAALQDMRGLIGDLRGGTDCAPGAPATMRAIGTLLADLRSSGARLTPYVVLESPERAGALLDTAVYRIVQEALTNAIKHAPGAAIDVYVHADPSSGARIRVVNPIVAPGSGVPVPGGGNGIGGIRERAAALDGTAWIGERADAFIVDVSLPWQERG